ncbi:NADH dehydrogenase-like protein YjlD [Nonomuraea coxensis DSM 45129]|uniref:NADH dehydrogenase-like protein YjlD n=1 Tax=Nonomuraea coxensis DSM 45129 TaxID=1122611 RepID=A0ABX8TTA5_9ACTN|nr:FAD-dependent oxidoreductase [Nonomuraea coxensis]QYC38700.1 NADH dehydrogenase-like protein YjlD [Nonomuraea coxensis DSM 45129]
MTNHIVVLGAGYAGLGAAKRAARRLGRADAKVTLVNAADRFVERVRLHQLAAGQPAADLPLARLLDGTGVELVIGRVTGLDPEARTVRLDGPPYELGYDVLVYALGSAADLDALPGAREHAYTPATGEEAVRLRKRLAAETRSVALVGAGLTGLETAAEFAGAYPNLRFELFCAGGLAEGLLSEPGRRHVRRVLGDLGVRVRDHTPVAKVGADGLLLGDGTEAPAGTVVWTGGFRVQPLAAAAGLATGDDGRIVVDGRLRSVSHPEILAIGDAAAANVCGLSPHSMSCQNAVPMGQYAGDAAARLVTGRESPPARLRYLLRCLSLGRRDGLVQFTQPNDRPRPAVVTGRAAAVVKEGIVRGTVWAMRHPGPYL